MYARVLECVAVEADHDLAAVVECDRLPVGQCGRAAVLTLAAPVPHAEQRDRSQSDARERVSLTDAFGDPQFPLDVAQVRARGGGNVDRHPGPGGRLVFEEAAVLDARIVGT